MSIEASRESAAIIEFQRLMEEDRKARASASASASGNSDAPVAASFQPTKQTDPKPPNPDESPSSSTAAMQDESKEPTLPETAIQLCIDAHNDAHKETMARTQSHHKADQAGIRAYCQAMPPLIGAENIRQFIACVAHGMLMGIIESNSSGRLLYAAQVAFSTQNRPEAKRNPLQTRMAGQRVP